MALSDSAKEILGAKISQIKESIDRLNILIEDYNNRIDALQAERSKKAGERQTLIKQLADLKTDTEA